MEDSFRHCGSGAPSFDVKASGVCPLLLQCLMVKGSVSEPHFLSFFLPSFFFFFSFLPSASLHHSAGFNIPVPFYNQRRQTSLSRSLALSLLLSRDALCNDVAARLK